MGVLEREMRWVWVLERELRWVWLVAGCWMLRWAWLVVLRWAWLVVGEEEDIQHPCEDPGQSPGSSRRGTSSSPVVALVVVEPMVAGWGGASSPDGPSSGG